eukprot:1186614-Prorocentrum_minimum.AAC.1
MLSRTPDAEPSQRASKRSLRAGTNQQLEGGTFRPTQSRRREYSSSRSSNPDSDQIPQNREADVPESSRARPTKTTRQTQPTGQLDKAPTARPEGPKRRPSPVNVANRKAEPHRAALTRSARGVMLRPHPLIVP